MKKKKLVIFGVEQFAELAYEYFTHDSEYEVVAFTVHEKYIKDKQFCGKPVVAFEGLEKSHPASSHEVYAAIVYGELNRIREKVSNEAKQKGYKLASYISSKAFVWHNAKIGEHCFVFEDNTIQPFVDIRSNVVIWSGNHIGHGSVIKDNAFISSHVVISGNCEIGENSFIGVNSTIGNNVQIGRDCWVSSGAIITGNIPAHSLVKSVKSEFTELNEEVLFKKLRGMNV